MTAFAPVVAEIARIQRDLIRPAFRRADGSLATLGAPKVYPVPPAQREVPPINSWINSWDIVDPPTAQIGYSVDELWVVEMVWYGRSVVTEYDEAYLEAGAVLDATRAEFYRSRHTSLGGLCDVQSFGGGKVFGHDPTISRTPITVTLNLLVSLTVEHD